MQCVSTSQGLLRIFLAKLHLIKFKTLRKKLIFILVFGVVLTLTMFLFDFKGQNGAMLRALIAALAAGIAFWLMSVRQEYRNEEKNRH